MERGKGTYRVVLSKRMVKKGREGELEWCKVKGRGSGQAGSWAAWVLVPVTGYKARAMANGMLWLGRQAACHAHVGTRLATHMSGMLLVLQSSCMCHAWAQAKGRNSCMSQTVSRSIPTKCLSNCPKWQGGMGKGRHNNVCMALIK